MPGSRATTAASAIRAPAPEDKARGSVQGSRMTLLHNIPWPSGKLGKRRTSPYLPALPGRSLECCD